jgi:hypothetical protein
MLCVSFNIFAQTESDDLIDEFLGIVNTEMAESAVVSDITFFGSKAASLNKDLSIAWQSDKGIIRASNIKPEITYTETAIDLKIGGNTDAVDKITLEFNIDGYFTTSKAVDKKGNFKALSQLAAPEAVGWGKGTEEEDATKTGITSYTNSFYSTIFNCQEFALLVLDFTAEKNNDYKITFYFDIGTVGPNALTRTEKKAYSFFIYGERDIKDGKTAWLHPALLNATYFSAIRYADVDFPTPVGYYSLSGIAIERIRGDSQINFALKTLTSYYVPSADWEVYYADYTAAEEAATK